MENTQDIKVTRGRPRKPRPIKEYTDTVNEKRGRGRPRTPPPYPTIPPPPKPPRKPKTPKEVSLWRDNKPLYFRMYNQNREKKKEECSRPHCGNEFDLKRTLKSHRYKSVLCKKLREIATIKGIAGIKQFRLINLVIM